MIDAVTTFTSQSAYEEVIRCGSGCEESSNGRNEIAQFQSVSIPMLSASAWPKGMRKWCPAGLRCVTGTQGVVASALHHEQRYN